MALVSCPECRAQISQYAEQCPSCGCPCTPMDDELYNRQLQKIKAARAHDFKIWLWLIAAFVVLGIVNVQSQGGCEAARQKRLEKEDRENKAWRAEQDRKARDDDVRRAREMWDRSR